MSQIADQLTPGSAVLFNESFAATNEQEGSEIARQMIRALQETGIKVFFVTHMYDLAGGLHEQATETAAFLRAPRQDEGQRTFRPAMAKTSTSGSSPSRPMPPSPTDTDATTHDPRGEDWLTPV